MASILFHRHTPWQSHVRCSTNVYAKLFMEDGYEVAYMQGLVHMGNVIARRGHWQSWLRGPRRDRGSWVFTPLSMVPYAKSWPFNTRMAAHLSYRTCVPSIGAQLRRGGMQTPDVIWSVNPGSVALRSTFPDARFVFQAVDYYPAFSGASIRNIERTDYRLADHVFVIGETLKRYIVDEHRIAPEKITVLGQGVFTGQYHDSWPVPADVCDLPRPRAIWIGVLEKADPQLFRAAAQTLRRMGGSLILVGPPARWSQEMARELGNVHVLGPRMPEEVPAYLMHADIGLMLYDQRRQDIYKGQNPLKLYEFAAAGLPTLSTSHDEYAYIDPPVIIANDARSVSAGMMRALDEREQLAAQALRFAAGHSWESAYRRARQGISDLLAAA